MDHFPESGEVIRPIGEDSHWVYIGSVDGNFYVVREGTRGHVLVYGNEELDVWEPAPEPFFEEGKEYTSESGARVYVHHVTTTRVSKLPVALAENLASGRLFALHLEHTQAYGLK